MAKKFKEGDICIIMGVRKIPHNNGKTVTLLKYVPAGQRGQYQSFSFGAPPEDAWIVKGEDILTPVMGILTPVEIAGFYQSKLFKIGDAEPDLTKTTEKEKPVIDLVNA